MTDIVERLRECRVVFEDVLILVDAADEIERLRGIAVSMATDIAERDQEIERLRGIEDAAKKAADIYETEIERLREALATCRELREIDKALIAKLRAPLNRKENPTQWLPEKQLPADLVRDR